MIYVKKDGEWFTTRYHSYYELKLYEWIVPDAVYDSSVKKVIMETVWSSNGGFKNTMTEEQVLLEFFLHKGKDNFKEWEPYSPPESNRSA